MRFARRLRRPGIIYCTTTREVDNVYTALQMLRIPAHRYHGKMASGRPQPSARDVHEDGAAHGDGGDQRFRPRHRQARHPLHRALPVARLARAVRAGGRARRPRRTEGQLHPALRRGRPRIHEALLQKSRVRPDQLYKLGTRAGCMGGRRPHADLEALALSAGQRSSRVTAALLAVLEEAGLGRARPRTADSASSSPPSRSRSARAAWRDSSKPCARRTAAAWIRIGEYA